MEFLLGGIVALAAAAFFLLVGAYFGRIAAQAQRSGEQQPREQEQEEPLSEEEQRELAERLSRVAAEMAGGIAQTLGAQFVDFSQVFVGQWPIEPAEKEASQEGDGPEKAEG